MAASSSSAPVLAVTRQNGRFCPRSRFRPNPIGMSLVALKGIECGKRA
ncbi:SAM-dependent methyltransferase [Salmonella enterica subsp. enterica]|nr:SAM-dependent methyltransferase [Salmonella enterica subsp. enterica]